MTVAELEIERARVWAEAAMQFRPALVGPSVACGEHGWRQPCSKCHVKKRPMFAQPDAQVGVL